MRHNPEGCEIILATSLSKDRSQYHFIVRDNGKGISPEQLIGITELLYSFKRNSTVQQGHGLGIPMVERIAEVHHKVALLSLTT